MDHFFYQLTLIFYNPEELFSGLIAEKKRGGSIVILGIISFLLAMHEQYIFQQDLKNIWPRLPFFLRDFLLTFTVISGFYFLFTAFWSFIGYLFTKRGRFPEIFEMWAYTYPLTFLWIMLIDFLNFQRSWIQFPGGNILLLVFVAAVTIFFIYVKINAYVRLLKKLWNFTWWQILMGSAIILPPFFLGYFLMWLQGWIKVWIF